jgi:hypothetical protein
MKIINWNFIVSIGLLTTLLLGNGCRKKVEREELANGNIVAHCSNYIMDADEIGTDCGGIDCDSCATNTPPCTLPENKLRMLHGPTIQNLNLYNKSYSVVESHWVFIAYTDAGNDEYIKFDFPSKPNITTIYKGQSDASFLESDEVYIYFYGYSTPDMYGAGDVYVNFIDGKYHLTSCDYSFHSSGGPTLTGQNFNISF